MDKNKLAAIEILSKVKESLCNIVASGEYTNDDKRDLIKTKAALKWLHESKESSDELGDCNMPRVGGSASTNPLNYLGSSKSDAFKSRHYR